MYYQKEPWFQYQSWIYTVNRAMDGYYYSVDVMKTVYLQGIKKWMIYTSLYYWIICCTHRVSIIRQLYTILRIHISVLLSFEQLSFDIQLITHLLNKNILNGGWS